MSTSIDRRTFIRNIAIAGAAVGMGIALPGCSDDGVDKSADASSQREGTAMSSSGISDATSASSNGKSEVYFTSEISSASLIAAYSALNHPVSGNVAVKVSTGEPGGHNFLSPKLIKGLVHKVDGTIVECNTAYGGKRSNTKSHLQAAKDHGFTDIADVVIMDAKGDIALPVENGKHLKSNYVGKALRDYDSLINLAHFKGHSMAGFGGVIKNSSIGIASSRGKSLIHTSGESESGFSGGTQDGFLESMGEAAKSIADLYGSKIVYINVMNNLSVDCDCSSNPAKPEMKDAPRGTPADPALCDGQGGL